MTGIGSGLSGSAVKPPTLRAHPVELGTKVATRVEPVTRPTSLLDESPSGIPSFHWFTTAFGNPRLETPRDRQRIFEALSACRSSLPERMRWSIAAAIEEQSRRHGYDPLFVQAMIEVESMCSPTARSPRGAIGLIQLRPETAQEVAREAGIKYKGPQTLLDPERNVELGLLYLNRLESQLGDLHLAVAAYNLGPGRVAQMPRRTARSARYVRKVLARYASLRAELTVA